MISPTLDKLHQRLAEGRKSNGNDPMSEAVADQHHSAPNAQQTEPPLDAPYGLRRLFGAAQPAQKTQPVPTNPQPKAHRGSRKVPIETLLDGVRFGSGPLELPQLSRRATARLQRDPFVQRLDRLHRA